VKKRAVINDTLTPRRVRKTDVAKAPS